MAGQYLRFRCFFQLKNKMLQSFDAQKLANLDTFKYVHIKLINVPAILDWAAIDLWATTRNKESNNVEVQEEKMREHSEQLQVESEKRGHPWQKWMFCDVNRVWQELLLTSWILLSLFFGKETEYLCNVLYHIKMGMIEERKTNLRQMSRVGKHRSQQCSALGSKVRSAQSCWLS